MTEELIKEATKYIDSRFKRKEFFTYWDLLYSIVDVIRPREKRLAELEKENAVLKEELESKDSIIADVDESEGYFVHENQELNAQLTKAKGIIKNFAMYITLTRMNLLQQGS